MLIRKILIIFLLLIPFNILFAQSNMPIITVLDFESEQISKSEMSSIISVLSSELFKTNLYTVIDVSQRKAMLNELEFSVSGCTDESCMLEVGKLLSAEMIVTGSIAMVGSRFVLSTKMLETESGKTISTSDGFYDDLDELLEDISSTAKTLSLPFAGTVTAEVKEADVVKKEVEAEKAPVDTYDYTTLTEMITGITTLQLLTSDSFEFTKIKMQSTDVKMRRDLYDEYEKDNAVASMFVNIVTFGIGGNFMQGFNELGIASIATTSLFAAGFVSSLIGGEINFLFISGGALFAVTYLTGLFSPYLYENKYNQYLKDSLLVY